MKVSQRAFQRLLACAVLSSLVLSNVPSAQARGGSDDDDDHDEITRVLTLTRTDAAPESARGVAKLEVGHRGDPASKRIELDTFGLAPGTYTVTVFDASGASVVLGTFTAGNDDDDDDDSSGSGRNRGPGSDDDLASRRGGDDDNDEGEADFTVPDSVSVLQLTTISVADEAGTEMLVGDFTDASAVQSGRSHARARLVGTDAAPDATGRVEARGQQRRGKGKSQFRVEARELPPSTPVIVSVDGTDVANATSDSRGRLRIRRSANELNVLSLSTVSIRDEAGTELATAQF